MPSPKKHLSAFEKALVAVSGNQEASSVDSQLKQLRAAYRKWKRALADNNLQAAKAAIDTISKLFM